MKKRIVLAGLGNIGQACIALLAEKRQSIASVYGLDLSVTGLLGGSAAIFDEHGLDLDLIASLPRGSAGITEYSRKKNVPLCDPSSVTGDVLVDATPTDIITGQPGLAITLECMKKGMDIVAVSKGALVTNFKLIMDQVKKKNIKIRYGSATAAALPTIDVGLYSLAGSSIISIEGILNGTTNYILSRMHEDRLSFKNALEEAQKKGIAESNSALDINGIDSACKIVLLANTLMGSQLSLNDIAIRGIADVYQEDVQEAMVKGRVIKLIAKAFMADATVRVEVGPVELPKKHMLATVNGTNKCIVFDAENMGKIAVLGGASHPKATAGATLKDLINMYSTH